MKSNSKSSVPLGVKTLGKPLPEAYPWKILGWVAEDLRPYLSEVDQEKIAMIVRSRDLSALLDLGESWGLQCMPTMDGSSLERAARYQLAALLKKFRFPTERKERKARAIMKFLDGEATCAAFNHGGWMSLGGAEEQWMVEVFTFARSFLEKLLGSEVPDLNVMTERSRHGPGATCDTDTGLVSSYHKYEKWPYQCTPAALGYARFAIKADERWIKALEADYRWKYIIPDDIPLDWQTFWSRVLTAVNGNRIAFVPKDARVERSIAIEPTLNLYLQLGVDGFIRQRLKRWGVDLDCQEKNQKLAYLGSTGMIDPYVTIDLANASNTISLMLCKLLLPQDWYDHLRMLRSPCGELDGAIIEYEMMSSMGNGFTFALESAIFTSIVYGVMMATNGRYDRGEFAVFGDDIICRQSISSQVIAALINCGFTVNESKTFVEGPVRESCGTDWFQGRLVRPVFLEDTPTEIDELFSDVNRIKRILDVRWGIEESKTVSCMLKWVPEVFRDFLGPYSDESFDSYIHCASPQSRYHRWVYKYKQVVRKAEKVKDANIFHFRKLMHDLHPTPPPSLKWDKWRKLTSHGGRFGVFRRGPYTLSTSYSVSSIWRREYAEYRPA